MTHTEKKCVMYGIALLLCLLGTTAMAERKYTFTGEDGRKTNLTFNLSIVGTARCTINTTHCLKFYEEVGGDVRLVEAMGDSWLGQLSFVSALKVIRVGQGYLPNEETSSGGDAATRLAPQQRAAWELGFTVNLPDADLRLLNLQDLYVTALLTNDPGLHGGFKTRPGILDRRSAFYLTSGSQMWQADDVLRVDIGHKSAYFRGYAGLVSHGAGFILPFAQLSAVVFRADAPNRGFLWEGIKPSYFARKGDAQVRLTVGKDWTSNIGVWLAAEAHDVTSKPATQDAPAERQQNLVLGPSARVKVNDSLSLGFSGELMFHRGLRQGGLGASVVLFDALFLSGYEGFKLPLPQAGVENRFQLERLQLEVGFNWAL